MDDYLSNKAEEVSELVKRYIVIHILKKSECEKHKNILNSTENYGLQKIKYLRKVSREGLVVPSGSFPRTVAATFAELTHIKKSVRSKSVRKLCYKALDKYVPQTTVSSNLHQKSNRKNNIIVFVYTFYNNVQKLSGDAIRM